MPAIPGYLDGKDDLIEYSEWIHGEITDWQIVNSAEYREELSDDELDEAFEEIRVLMVQLVASFEESGSPDDVHSVLSQADVAEPYNRYMNCVKEERHSSYHWKVWSTGHQDLVIKQSEVDALGLDPSAVGRPIGYSNQLVRSRLLRNSALIQHTYSEIPDQVTWELIPVTQGGKTMYMGARPFAEIDAVSMVPWIPPQLQSQQFASRAINGSLQRDDQWQRLVSKARLEEIRAFARGMENYMFNPVLLYVNKNHESVSFDEQQNTLTVDFNFLGEKNGQFYDYIQFPMEIDRRPLWIVDGQHRVRGFGGAARGSKMSAPFVLMVGDNDDEARKLVARVFTEINTNARALDKMHQLYLKWQFKIPSESVSNDFRTDAEGSPTDRSRPNRIAYELALKLAADTRSPLFNAIQFQEPDKSSAPRARMKKHLIVKATNWMQKARRWFSNQGVYSDPQSDAYSSEEVLNFFIAFQNTCNHDEWEDGLNRWKDPEERKKKRSVIQQQGPFRALMDMVPYTIQKLEHRFPNPSRPFTVEHFESVLAPLKNVDWNRDGKDDQGLASLKGRGNLNVPHLKMWMQTAIDHGQVYSWQEIHNKNMKSLPGRGLNAGPSNHNLAIELEADCDPWPGVLPMVLTMERPVHSLRSFWQVTASVDGKQETIDVQKAWKVEDNRRTELVLESDALPPNTEAIRIDGGWRNGIDDALATTKVYYSP